MVGVGTLEKAAACENIRRSGMTGSRFETEVIEWELLDYTNCLHVT